MCVIYLDDICHRNNNGSPNHICLDYRKCPYLEQAIKEGKRPPVCSFKNEIPIICCPPDPSYNTNKPSSNRPLNNGSFNNKPSNNVPTNNRPSNNRPSNNGSSNNRPSNNNPFNNRPSNNRPSNSATEKPPISNPSPPHVTAKTYSAAESMY